MPTVGHEGVEFYAIVLGDSLALLVDFLPVVEFRQVCRVLVLQQNTPCNAIKVD